MARTGTLSLPSATRRLSCKRVPWHDTPVCWPDIEEWVNKALKDSLVYTAKNIREALLLRQMTLWVASTEDGEIRACAVTVVRPTNSALICSILLVGGKGVKDWIAFQDDIAEWAKAQGCIALETNGRRGWKKILDWEPVYTVYRRML